MKKFKNPVFLLEISYKSGYSFQMWFKEFENNNGIWKWEVPDGSPRPFLLGVDDIVSVIQLDIKEE